MKHYDLTPQERTQIDGRWHNVSAPLCGSGDGHYAGDNPANWSTPYLKDGDHVIEVDCPRCCDRKHLIAKRERDLVHWKGTTE